MADLLLQPAVPSTLQKHVRASTHAHILSLTHTRINTYRHARTLTWFLAHAVFTSTHTYTVYAQVHTQAVFYTTQRSVCGQVSGRVLLSLAGDLSPQ